MNESETAAEAIDELTLMLNRAFTDVVHILNQIAVTLAKLEEDGIEFWSGDASRIVK